MVGEVRDGSLKATFTRRRLVFFVRAAALFARFEHMQLPEAEAFDPASKEGPVVVGERPRRRDFGSWTGCAVHVGGSVELLGRCNAGALPGEKRATMNRLLPLQ